MQILSNTTVNKLVNSVNLTTLASDVSTLNSTITTKANSNDLPTGTYDETTNLGRLQEIRFDPNVSSISFVFSQATVFVEAPSSL